jgi:hypothetical protein
MADASRFPRLIVPFAVVGAAAGWLSAELASNPLLRGRVSRPVAALAASLAAALIGLIIRRLCVGRRYSYQMEDPDPETRPWADRWPVHVVLVLIAGAGIGAGISEEPPVVGAVGGAACALAFVPVCLAVIAAARRAQRARLGSLVAATDRRAVWGILAITLAVTTLEALPAWPASTVKEAPAPLVALWVLLATCAVTIGILRSDQKVLAEAEVVIKAGLSAWEPAGVGREDGDEVARLDLGLGEDMQARIARGAAAYRDRERTVALVRGAPEAALHALRRAVRRSEIGLVVTGAVLAAHAAAQTTPALVAYEDLRCSYWNGAACSIAADLTRDPVRATGLRQRGRGGRAGAEGE